MNDFVLLTTHPRSKLYSIHGKTAEFTEGHFIHNLKFNSPVHSFSKSSWVHKGSVGMNKTTDRKT